MSSLLRLGNVSLGLGPSSLSLEDEAVVGVPCDFSTLLFLDRKLENLWDIVFCRAGDLARPKLLRRCDAVIVEKGEPWPLWNKTSQRGQFAVTRLSHFFWNLRESWLPADPGVAPFCFFFFFRTSSKPNSFLDCCA